MSRHLVLALGLLLVGSIPASGATLSVCASGCMYTDPQAAINAARFGDTVLLRAGETFVAHLQLPAKSGTGWIDIRSDTADSLLPAPSVRLVPDDRPGSNTPRSRLARIIGRGGAYKTSALLRTDPGAHGYRVSFLEFDGVAHLGYETLVQLGGDDSAAAPYDIVLDRVYVHGHRTKGQKRGIALHGVRLAVLNSYIADIKAVNADSQGVVGYNGYGPLRIENTHIEAAGENVLFGGGDPATTGLVPADISIHRNHLFKPLTWRDDILSRPGSLKAGTAVTGSLPSGTHYFRVVALMDTGTRTAVSAPSTAIAVSVSSGRAVPLNWSGATGADRYRIYRGTSSGSQAVYLETSTSATSFTYTGASEKSGTPPTSGTKWVVKNTLELKNAERVTIQGNTFENIWNAGQYGYSIVLTPRNAGNAPWTRVRDVSITGNIVHGASGIINISGYDDTGTTLRTERITIRNNLFYDIDNSKYGGLAKAFLIGDGPADVVIDKNTIVHTNSSVVYPYGSRTIPGFVYTNNSSLHNKYGIMGSSSSTGLPTIDKFFPDGVVTCNVLAGGSASLYPAPNAFPTVAQWTGSFEDYANADFRLKTGSVVALSGCAGQAPGVDFAILDAALGGATTPTPTPDPVTDNTAPVARPGGPYSIAGGASLAVTGSASTDADGSIVRYLWTWGDEIAVRAADVPAAALIGSEWVKESSTSAADGIAIRNPDRGAAKRTSAQASPPSYVEFKVPVASGVPYRLWMRMNAAGNSYSNDSLYVQFSGAVTAAGQHVARIGTSEALAVVLEEGSSAGIAGWGWNDHDYGAIAAPIYFAASGLQTIRIQAREDGIAWDQVVLSSEVYYDAAPGLLKNDTIVVPESLGTSQGVTATHAYTRDGRYPLQLFVTDDDGVTSSAATTVTVGDGVAGEPLPTTLAAVTGGPYTAPAGTRLGVNGAASTGVIAAYRWTWGDEVLVRAADLPSSAITGSAWQREVSTTAAGGAALRNPDRGASKRSAALASPSSYVEFAVWVAAGVPYRLWMRMGASGDSYSNDSLFVQFDQATDAAGASVGRIGTTDALAIVLEEGSGAGVSGWGWNDADYGGLAEPVYFRASGRQLIRVQSREDGIAWDQLILTTGEYINSAPGTTRNDSVVVPDTLGTSEGATPAHTYRLAGVYPLRLTVSDGGGASNSAETTVTVSGGS